MKKTEGKKQDPTEVLHGNPALPSVLIDKIQTLPRGDGMCMLRFFSSVPEGSFEYTRVMVTDQLIRSFLNNTCKMLDHYPKPEEGDSQE